MATDEPQVTGSEPRKKRAKIVSACAECRRRKTRCNGELPCKSCHKADVPCVYPVVSHAEDKRNHLSKAALEAIEDRLKAIEDMLHTILRSQSFVAELPAAAVNQFLNSKVSPTSPPTSSVVLPRATSYNRHHTQQLSSTSSSCSSFVALPPPSPSTSHQQSIPSYTSSLPSPKQQQQHHPKLSTTTTTSSPLDVRLPSIHDLSAHSAYSSPPLGEIKQEVKDTTTTDLLPPPLGYSPYYARNNCRYELSADSTTDENMLSSIKKRKRS